MEYKLSFYIGSQCCVTLPLYHMNHKNSYYNHVLYCDKDYDVFLTSYDEQRHMESQDEINNVQFYINDNEKDILYSKGKIIFIGNNNEIVNRVFYNNFGFVQFFLSMDLGEHTLKLKSDYVDIAVRDNNLGNVLKSMQRYIIKNARNYLWNSLNPALDDAAIEVDYNNNSYMDKEMVLLNNILLQYKINMNYFKNGGKYTIQSSGYVDDFHKLSDFSRETFQHIACNPQELHKVNYYTGIRYNGFNLQPKKILNMKNTFNYDIYENQIILGFLKQICNTIEKKICKMENFNIPCEKKDIEQHYMSSSSIIFHSFDDRINSYRESLRKIQGEIFNIYYEYRNLLSCKELPVQCVPKPTPIFIKDFHYRRIYSVIREWFEKGDYDLKHEELMLNCNTDSNIYEYYILIEINEYLTKHNYQLKKSYQFQYTLPESAKYKNTIYNNTFVFSKEDDEITVYYQPVISYNNCENEIGLFKNSDINEENKKSYYYTPDYVIKICRNGKTEYIILDAKWSNLDSVKQYSFKSIIYKYLFSISTIKKEDVVSKIWIVNGKSDDTEECIYDYYNNVRYKSRCSEITPSAKIITLNLNKDLKHREYVLEQLFK
ncbi:hypothetical protein SAMN02745248_01538 [Hathewaya proteolytica DSM 3090]|uniref:DUF2357 domain-containing protein n=1 Tax=Hathewaya proteolytica DSM 3090 TaxID=1121331 RepID=A0A1M6NX09_9CLOT|nr:hypothetical protein [Hathewaya proteolytica]SHK00279.1 hypothetical protein SAMN02745248_01538 [Hathewaya proteolytica DSM 3090]